MGMRLVEEEEHGLYIWITGDGRKIADADGNVMNIPSKRGDKSKIAALRKAARHYGVYDGKPLFLPGHRQITDGEFEYQMERLQAGLIPDPLDFRAVEEEQKYAKKYR